ncbi:MAG: hypothetical protein ACTHLD_10705 [Chitinophaga sp.]
MTFFKRIWLLTLLLTGLTATSFAQLSKMQFEDAELAFSEGKYANAIVLLDAAEKSNNGANPPIIHLRIMCRMELIRLDPYMSFDTIDKARKETDFFLKQYQDDASLEEKYRDVYKASKVLKGLPLTRASFEQAARNRK